MKRISDLSLADLSVMEFQLAKISSKWGWEVLPDDPQREYKVTIHKRLEFVRQLLQSKVINEFICE